MDSANASSSGSVRRAADDWLDTYRSCERFADSWDKGFAKDGARVAREDAPVYGGASAKQPRAEHLWKAVLAGARSLNESGFFYVLGGGLAVNLHGQRRATTDVDFFILGHHEGLVQVREALARRDIRPHRLERPSFMPPDALFWWEPYQFGFPDAPPVNVDLLVASHEFMAFLHATGVESHLEGVRLRVLGAEGLIVLKLQAFRDKDRWDVKEILKRNPKLDRALLMSWVAKFKLEERLSQMERELAAEGPRRG